MSSLSFDQVCQNLNPRITELQIVSEEIVKDYFAEKHTYAMHLKEAVFAKSSLRKPHVQVSFFLEGMKLSRFVCLFSKDKQYLCTTLEWKEERVPLLTFDYNSGENLYQYLYLTLNP